MKIIKVYMSYAVFDDKIFKIGEIKEVLENKPMIKEILTSGDNDHNVWEIRLNNTIENCDVFVLYCSDAIQESKKVAEEWEMAYLSDKLVIPVYTSEEEIPNIFKTYRSYHYDSSRKIEGIAEDIYSLILEEMGYVDYSSYISGSEEHLNQLLRDLMITNKAIRGIALVSREGLLVNSILPEDISPMHIAAMSASLLSISERSLHEFDMGEHLLSVELGRNGKVICMECGWDFLLICACDYEADVYADLVKYSRIIQKSVDETVDPQEFTKFPAEFEPKSEEQKEEYHLDSGVQLKKRVFLRKHKKKRLFKQTQKLFLSGDYEGTIKLMETIIKIEEKNDFAWYIKGCSLFNIAKYARAIFCFNRMLEIVPNDLEAWKNKAYALYKLKKYSEALECYNSLLKIHSENSSLWAGKALVYSRNGDFENSIICFNKALELNPKNVKAWNDKGIAYYHQENYKKSIECYDQALKIDPKYTTSWHNKAESLLRMDQWEKTLYCINRTLEIEPSNPYSWFLKAEIFNKLRRPKDEVRECLLKAMNNMTAELLYRIEISDFNIPRFERF